MNEEGYLTKTFKFFDIHNKGAVSLDQFYRTIEKIGVIIDKEVRYSSLICDLGSYKHLQYL
jgi:Ca2+-binding EF-hand superfamily protein